MAMVCRIGVDTWPKLVGDHSIEIRRGLQIGNRKGRVKFAIELVHSVADFVIGRKPQHFIEHVQVIAGRTDICPFNVGRNAMLVPRSRNSLKRGSVYDNVIVISLYSSGEVDQRRVEEGELARDSAAGRHEGVIFRRDNRIERYHLERGTGLDRGTSCNVDHVAQARFVDLDLGHRATVGSEVAGNIDGPDRVARADGSVIDQVRNGCVAAKSCTGGYRQIAAQRSVNDKLPFGGGRQAGVVVRAGKCERAGPLLDQSATAVDRARKRGVGVILAERQVKRVEVDRPVSSQSPDGFTGIQGQGADACDGDHSTIRDYRSAANSERTGVDRRRASIAMRSGKREVAGPLFDQSSATGDRASKQGVDAILAKRQVELVQVHCTVPCQRTDRFTGPKSQGAIGIDDNRSVIIDCRSTVGVDRSDVDRCRADVMIRAGKRERTGSLFGQATAAGDRARKRGVDAIFTERQLVAIQMYRTCPFQRTDRFICFQGQDGVVLHANRSAVGDCRSAADVDRAGFDPGSAGVTICAGKRQRTATEFGKKRGSDVAIDGHIATDTDAHGRISPIAEIRPDLV